MIQEDLDRVGLLLRELDIYRYDTDNDDCVLGVCSDPGGSG